MYVLSIRKLYHLHPQSHPYPHLPDPGLDGLHDLLVLRRLRQAAGEIHHRDVRRGHPEGHTAVGSMEGYPLVMSK